MINPTRETMANVMLVVSFVVGVLVVLCTTGPQFFIGALMMACSCGAVVLMNLIGDPP